MKFDQVFTVATKGALALCVAALATPAFAVNLVTNGNFATIASGDTTSADYSVVTQYLTDGVYGTGLPDWTVGSLSNPPGNNVLVCLIDYSQNTTNAHLCGTALDGNMSLYTMPGASPDGGNYLMMDAVSSYADPLQQTITGLVANTHYTLTFYEATGQQSGFAGATTEQWNVSLGSETVNGDVRNTAYQGSDGWQLVTMNFTASSTSEVLSFAANGTPAGQPPMIMLDGVSLTSGGIGFQGAVPEPGTIALVGMGLLTLGLGMRKRRTKLVAAKVPVTL